MQRLHDVNPQLQDSSNTLSSSFPPPTPSRPTVALGANISYSRARQSLANNGTKITFSSTQELVGNKHQLPLKYDVTPSPPSPPHSPPISPPTSFQPEKSSAEKNHNKTYGEHGSMVSPSLYDNTYSTTPRKTPTKRCGVEGCSTTPSSTMKYRRALDLGILSPRQESPKASQIMERYDAVYQSLTCQPSSEEWDSELRGEDCSPVLDSESGSHSWGVLPSSRVLTRAPACPYVTVTNSDGARVYLKLQHDKVSLPCTVSLLVFSVAFS